jgi:hypothetical protein
MGMLFTENAANSSLHSPIEAYGTAGVTGVLPPLEVEIASQSLHNPVGNTA